MTETIEAAISNVTGESLPEHSLSTQAEEVFNGFTVFLLSFCSLFLFAILYITIICSGLASFWSMLAQS